MKLRDLFRQRLPRVKRTAFYVPENGGRSASPFVDVSKNSLISSEEILELKNNIRRGECTFIYFYMLLEYFREIMDNYTLVL